MNTLVLGGIRSGKSSWAEISILNKCKPSMAVRYIATCLDIGNDYDWSNRIKVHQKRRPSYWYTIETDDLISELCLDKGNATLVDDVGSWLMSNIEPFKIFSKIQINKKIKTLINIVNSFSAPLFIVSPEVGLTIVSANKVGRQYSDILGEINQQLAKVCHNVILIIAGQPVILKGSLYA